MLFKHSLYVWLFVAAIFGHFQTESAIAAPGEFVLTSAIPGCNGGSPQITLNWTTSSGVMTYDLYRDGVLYIRDIPALGHSFPDTGANVAEMPDIRRCHSDPERVGARVACRQHFNSFRARNVLVQQ